jgi:hypothetical protein
MSPTINRALRTLRTPVLSVLALAMPVVVVFLFAKAVTATWDPTFETDATLYSFTLRCGLLAIAAAFIIGGNDVRKGNHDPRDAFGTGVLVGLVGIVAEVFYSSFNFAHIVYTMDGPSWELDWTVAHSGFAVVIVASIFSALAHWFVQLLTAPQPQPYRLFNGIAAIHQLP